jgi:lipooligosaccharide transport system ATP-binding protein
MRLFKIMNQVKINPVILENVSKTYKDIKAVCGLSFSIDESTCFGILGPNGAGKTTTMKMLTGKAMRDDRKDSKINIFGFDPCSHELEIKYISGIVPQENNLDEELNVMQNLLVYTKFYGIKKRIAKNKIEELLDFMELGAKKNAKVRQLSGGMKRRLVIVRALLNNPKILILDEPTTGLDPQVRHSIWDKLRILKKDGVTIIITTHYMEEAFQLCDRLILMNNGKKVLEGNPAKLIKDNIEKYVLELFNKDIMKKIKIGRDIRIDKTENRIFLYSDDIRNLEVISKKTKPGDFYLRQSNLEDLFLTVTGRKLYE